MPLNMTSIICWLRRLLADISPSDQRMASDIFDLPQPFGPTTAVTPGSNSIRVLSAKDLNPTISSRFNLTAVRLLFSLDAKQINTPVLVVFEKRTLAVDGACVGQ